MDNFILVTEKEWYNQIYEELKIEVKGNWTWIKEREDFNPELLAEKNANWIFIPHWSYIIPKEIFDNFKCVVFHMTDLPFGRGGSPLQNLIVRGLTETKISAIKVAEDVDSGDIYLKQLLSLHGSAAEIFIRSAKLIKEMIIKLIIENPQPSPQEGEPILFKRRKPSESNIKYLTEIETVYNYIRMLDCEGYPSAFLETDYFKFEFKRASLEVDGSITADVRISKK
jgi:methionyl-tRNA formyltransferase